MSVHVNTMSDSKSFIDDPPIRSGFSVYWSDSVVFGICNICKLLFL